MRIVAAIGLMVMAIGESASETNLAERWFELGPREVVATAEQRRALGLHTFMDGNLGVVKNDDEFRFYGANGSRPIRVSGTLGQPFRNVEEVVLTSTNVAYAYLAGGPVFRDPDTGRLVMFYHAELHPGGDAKKFYSLVGLAVQSDSQGLAFQDVGPVFVPHIPHDQATSTVEVCGAPYVIRDGFFYVYARDTVRFSKGDTRENNLSVVRARVDEVVASAFAGRPAHWRKYYAGEFGEPGVGGKSTLLESGNPSTRWMDVSYNIALNAFIMVAAAPGIKGDVALYISRSQDGLHWSKREILVDELGESFYVSVVGLGDEPRKTGSEFDLYYTSSAVGGWNRWSDAQIIRRRVRIRQPERD